MSKSRTVSFRCEKLSPAAVRFVVSSNARPSFAYSSRYDGILKLLLSYGLYIRICLLLSAIGLLTFIVQERQQSGPAAIDSSSEINNLSNDEFFLRVYLYDYLPWIGKVLSNLSIVKGLWSAVELFRPFVLCLADAWRCLFYTVGDVFGINPESRIPLPVWLGLGPRTIVHESLPFMNSTYPSPTCKVDDFFSLESIIQRSILGWIVVSLYIIAVCYICLRRSSREETMVVMQSIGIQLFSQGRTFLSDKSTFIPASCVEEIYIHEAFYGQAVVFFLAIQSISSSDIDSYTSSSEMGDFSPIDTSLAPFNNNNNNKDTSATLKSQITVVFPQLLPRRAILEQVWRESRKCLFRDRPDKLTLLL